MRWIKTIKIENYPRDRILKTSFNRVCDVLERYAVILKLDVKVKTIARQILETVVRKGLRLMGPWPQGYAGAAIYLAGKKTGRKLSQTAISKKIDISEETLRQRRRTIERYLKKIKSVG